jgi:hypothetical protein
MLCQLRHVVKKAMIFSYQGSLIRDTGNCATQWLYDPLALRVLECWNVLDRGKALSRPLRDVARTKKLPGKGYAASVLNNEIAVSSRA